MLFIYFWCMFFVFVPVSFSAMFSLKITGMLCYANVNLCKFYQKKWMPSSKLTWQWKITIYNRIHTSSFTVVLPIVTLVFGGVTIGQVQIQWLICGITTQQIPQLNDTRNEWFLDEETRVKEELQVELIICPNGSKYLIKMHCEHRFGPRVSSQYLDS